MLYGHSVDALLAHSYRVGTWFDVWTFQRGLTSSLFLLLSGFASPVQNMPGWLQPVAMINPLTHFMVIMRGVFLRDMPVWLVAQRIWPMALIAAVTLSAAAWLFRRRVE